MKVLDIAFKDLIQAFRSRIAIMFMFVVPMLVTGLFYLIFGNIAGGDEGFTLPQTAVIVVNLDEGQLSGIGSMGRFLTGMLGSDDLSELVNLSTMTDPAAARLAVDNQEAGVALIIPPDFTDVIIAGEETAEIELYRDPTLTLGPAVVAGIVHQFVDGMSAANISVGVTMEQLMAADVPFSEELVQEVVNKATAVPPPQQDGQLTVLQAPPGQEETNELAQMIAFVLGGMMVFFTFFTGGNGLMSILVEEENGTLQRLFITPTRHMTIFSGKFISALLMLTVQVAVLMLFGLLVFDIQWGEPLPVALAVAGLVLIAATCGLFLVSLIQSTRQAGIVFGGLLTLTGMIGLSTVFTAGAPNTPAVMETMTLLVPQGWAIRTFRQAMDGVALNDILFTFFIILLWSAVFFFIGQRRLQKRFA